MAQPQSSLQIQPGRGLGFLLLGASLHDVVTRLRSQSQIFPSIHIAYSNQDTLRTPVTVSLPRNGVRLRFDGQDQRLRLIEVLDFTKTVFSYKNTKSSNQVKIPVSGEARGAVRAPTGPSYRQIYDIFSVTFPGEYFPPENTQKRGTYVLSYPGLAFSFSVEHSAWATKSDKSDFVAVLSSSAASPARSFAIFNGSSWKEARQDYLGRPMPHSRTLATGRAALDEIEMVRIRGNGRLQFVRRTSRTEIRLGHATPQDIVAELGPPDAVYRKNDWRLAIHKRRNTSTAIRPQLSSPSLDQADDDPALAITDESDPEDEATAATGAGDPHQDKECFFNYFRYGIDIFFSTYPTSSPPLVPLATTAQSSLQDLAPATGGKFVATKVHLHANVPGSYAFNRYRRCRWTIEASSRTPFPSVAATAVPSSKPNADATSTTPPILTSEIRFSDISKVLRKVWAKSYANEEEREAMERPMVLNRGWTDSPGSSCELLGGMEESYAETEGEGWDGSGGGGGRLSAKKRKGGAGDVGMANTELYGFPGLLFEVLKNDAVGCLTIY